MKIGVAFTRFQSKFFKAKYGQLNKRELISFGPCQTPTLGFIVGRSNEREWFNAENYWTVEIQSCKPKWSTHIILSWARGRIFNQKVASMFYSIMKYRKTIKCIKIEKTVKMQKKPLPLNTVQMLLRNIFVTKYFAYCC